MPLRRRLLIVVTSAYLVALALVGLWPRHVDEGFSIVQWPPILAVVRFFHIDYDVAYTVLEASANLLWFVPFGILVGTVVVRRPLRAALVAGLVTSGSIELAQLLFRPERTAGFTDVVTNTLGTIVGALAVSVVRRRRAARPATAPRSAPSTHP